MEKGSKNGYKNPKYTKALKKMWQNEDYRKRQINSHLGNKQTEETKRKISENSARAISVLQFSLNGDFIKKWDRIKSAVKNGYNSSSISLCCSGKLKTHKGYIWIYEKDYTEEFINNRVGEINIHCMTRSKK